MPCLQHISRHRFLQGLDKDDLERLDIHAIVLEKPGQVLLLE